MNKTTYYKGFYYVIALYKVKHSLLASVGMFSMATQIVSGISAMEAGNDRGWWVVFSGAILTPIIVFIIPFIINMHNYKKTKKQNNNQDLEVSIELTEHKIVLRNSMTQNQVTTYDNIRDMVDKGGLLTIQLKSGQTLYFGVQPENFIGCTKEEFEARLAEKSGKKVFDV